MDDVRRLKSDLVTTQQELEKLREWSRKILVMYGDLRREKELISGIAICYTPNLEVKSETERSMK